MDTIIKDYLDIIHDIELRDDELHKLICWIYRHTYYKYYRRKLISSLIKLNNVILSKDNVQELIYYLANTFASDNGHFFPVLESKVNVFREGTKQEYTMYSAKVQIGNSSAEIKTYSNDKSMEVIYHTNIIDINNNSSSFTMINDFLKLDTATGNTNYKTEAITHLNEALIGTIQNYILYCLENYKRE